MSKTHTQAHGGAVPVHLDAVEVSVALAALPLESHRLRNRADLVEHLKLDGWQIEAAVLRAKAEVADSLWEKLHRLGQYELPFSFVTRHVAEVARPREVAAAFPLNVRRRMIAGERRAA